MILLLPIVATFLFFAIMLIWFIRYETKMGEEQGRAMENILATDDDMER